MFVLAHCLPWPLRPSATQHATGRAASRTRSIETEHFRYVAQRPGARRLWAVTAHPTSAAARYYVAARGQGIHFTCPLATLPAFIQQVERELAGYWGPVLDTRREWP